MAVNTRPRPGVALTVRYALWSLLVASTAHAQSPGDVVVPIKSVPAFKNPLPSLQRYVEHEPKARGPQHFCVVAYQSPEDDSFDKRAYVLWREGRQLILWEEAADPKDSSHLLLYSRRVWNLDKDVVPTPADIHGSSYLVDRGWVRRIQSACERSGTSFVLVRR